MDGTVEIYFIPESAREALLKTPGAASGPTLAKGLWVSGEPQANGSGHLGKAILGWRSGAPRQETGEKQGVSSGPVGTVLTPSAPIPASESWGHTPPSVVRTGAPPNSATGTRGD